MFHIQFFVDDKNLGEAFKRLAGIARDLKHVYVPNVEPKGKPKANGHARVAIADATETFKKELRKRKTTTITGPEFRDMIKEMGLNPLSYAYYVQNLVKDGVLKKGKLEGNAKTYHVVDK